MKLYSQCEWGEWRYCEGGVLNINTIEDRFMNALGSTRNFGVFVLANVNLNCYKRIVSLEQDSLSV